MDSFNIVWCTLWSDYFMTQHQFDTENDVFNVPTELANDFLFYLAEILRVEKKGYFIYDHQETVSVKLSEEEVERLTDWIMDFNFSTRKPIGIPMPDLYLDEESIRPSTVNAYCHRISEFLTYILKNQNLGREKIGEWAMQNILAIYSRAYRDALEEKSAHKKTNN